MKLLMLCITWIAVPTFASASQPKPGVDKVTCPVGYQLVDGTYRTMEGGTRPQRADIKNNTLIMEFPKHSKGQAIAVCVRIPL